MAFTKTPEKPLLDRITEIRAEADKWIDAEAAKVKEQNPGLPIAVIQKPAHEPSGACQCAAVRRISEQG